jgi:hypothetical protein
MRSTLIAMSAAAGLSLAGCTTWNTDPGVRGAAAGGAVGAAAGAVVGEVAAGEPLVGAAGGAIAGAIVGALINGRQYYRDRNGACFWVDQYGRRHYDGGRC